MPRSRTPGLPWLLLLTLVCCLLGRPLHDAWHIAHPGGEVVSAAAEMAVDAAINVATDVSTEGDMSLAAADQGDVSDEEGGGAKADACAWCLFHGQAAAVGHAPAALLVHAEASPPPAALPGTRLASRDWTVAQPRGPPSA